MLTWDKPNERYYEHGLDRGVLYITGKDPIPWNGITGFDEGASGTTSMLYRDGVIYLSDADASDFSGKINALFFPDAFHECLGMPEVADGMYVDNQKPKRFGFSYRSLIGNGGSDDLFGYQIHLVYNAMASISSRSRKTIGSTSEAVDFAFDIVCTPVKLAGYRPTAHYIIDTRNMSPGRIIELENMIYGDGTTPGSLPDPNDLYDLMFYGDVIVVTLHTGGGDFTVEASADNVFALDANHFQMNNINGTDNGDGTYILADGGSTDVIIE
jgi:hypothetical protein